MTEKSVFDDIMTGLHEIEEHLNGDIELRVHTVPQDNDNEVDIDQILWHKIIALREPQKRKLTTYVDELLQA